MNSLEEILARKSRLCSDISRQRARLSLHADGLQPLISGVDRTLAVARSVRAHPGWLAAGAGVLSVVMALMMRRQKKSVHEGSKSAPMLRWLSRGLFAWRTGTWVWGLLQGALRKA